MYALKTTQPVSLNYTFSALRWLFAFYDTLVHQSKVFTLCNYKVCAKMWIDAKQHQTTALQKPVSGDCWCFLTPQMIGCRQAYCCCSFYIKIISKLKQKQENLEKMNEIMGLFDKLSSHLLHSPSFCWLLWTNSCAFPKTFQATELAWGNRQNFASHLVSPPFKKCKERQKETISPVQCEGNLRYGTEIAQYCNDEPIS